MRADSSKLKQLPTFFFTAMNTHICLINQFISLCSCSVETVGKSIKNQPFWIVEILLKEYSQFDSRCLCYSLAVSCNMYENTHQRIPQMNGFLVEVTIYGCSMGSLLQQELGIQVLLCVLGTFFLSLAQVELRFCKLSHALPPQDKMTELILELFSIIMPGLSSQGMPGHVDFSGFA